jgi:hypothetical protein
MSTGKTYSTRGRTWGKFLLSSLIVIGAIAPAAADEDSYNAAESNSYGYSTDAYESPANVSYYRDDAYATNAGATTPSDLNYEISQADVALDAGRNVGYVADYTYAAQDPPADIEDGYSSDAQADDQHYWPEPANHESSRDDSINTGEVNGVFVENYGASGSMYNNYNKQIDSASYDTGHSNGYRDNQPTQFSRL